MSRKQVVAVTVPASKASKAQIQQQMNMLKNMLSAGMAGGSSSANQFNWEDILKQQPDLLEKAQSIAMSQMAASAPATTSSSSKKAPHSVMAIDKKDYPPGLFYPTTHNPDYPTIVLYFYITLWELLTIVRKVWDECKATVDLMNLMEHSIHLDPKLLRIGISEYYDNMKPYFGNVERKDRSFLTKATHLPFFNDLKMAEKLTDPDITVQEIDHLLDRIERLNALSEIHRLVPSSIFNVIYEAAYEHLASGATSAPNMEQAQSMGIDLLQRIPAEELMNLFHDTDKMKTVVKDFDKLRSLPGLEEFAKVAKQILSLLDGPQDLI